MSITPPVRNQVFDQSAIDAMSQAFKEACALLGLTAKADSLTELVATHVITIAQRGALDAHELYIATMQEFGVSLEALVRQRGLRAATCAL